MGIDVHAINFLKKASKIKDFGDTITVGRQGLHVNEVTLRKIVELPHGYSHDAYCETLIKQVFRGNNVESIDNSSYENANYIHDMNMPLPSHLTARFDTVIDGGCLEHIFNVSQAFENCSRMCKAGGQIIHILPANNFCGHGFWQFSPELFFSLYSEENGYEQTEVYLAKLSDQESWYKVKPPTNGQRANVLSSSELYVLVRTVLKGSDFTHERVQQSDYVYHWESEESSLLAPVGNPVGLKQRIGAIGPVKKVLLPAYNLYRRANRALRMSDRNPALTRVDIE